MNCPGASLGLQNIGIKRQICWFLIDQILWLFHPIFLSLQLAYFTIKNEMMLDSRDIDDEEYIENIDKQQNLMLYLKLYKKMELNLENIFQLTGKIILIAIVDSQTRTTQGVCSSAIFEDTHIFGIPAKTFIYLSIAFSIASFPFAQTDGIAGLREYFPPKSKLLIGCSALISSIVRIMSFILYFSPCLGLWNLLRHYQG